MGLSESEKRVLEELERNLYADEPGFAKKTKAKIDRASYSNSPSKIVAGALLAVIGISMLVFGAITQVPAFGVAGFLVMLFGILMASATAKAPKLKPGNPVRPAKGNFFEDRWDKRTDG